jgi:hypothetical protein
VNAEIVADYAIEKKSLTLQQLIFRYGIPTYPAVSGNGAQICTRKCGRSNFRPELTDRTVGKRFVPKTALRVNAYGYLLCSGSRSNRHGFEISQETTKASIEPGSMTLWTRVPIDMMKPRTLWPMNPALLA